MVVAQSRWLSVKSFLSTCRASIEIISYLLRLDAGAHRRWRVKDALNTWQALDASRKDDGAARPPPWPPPLRHFGATAARLPPRHRQGRSGRRRTGGRDRQEPALLEAEPRVIPGGGRRNDRVVVTVDRDFA